MSDGHGLYTQTVAPTSKPITVEELKSHSRIDHPDDDTLIAEYIEAARTYLENWLDIAFFTQTWTLKLDQFPSVDNPILIEKTPLASVPSITHIDTAGDSQTTLASIYTVDTDHRPGRVYLAPDQSWPNTRTQRKAVTVTFVAGHATTALIPKNWKQTIYLLTADYYEQREAALLQPFTFKENPTFKRLENSIRMRPVVGAA